MKRRLFTIFSAVSLLLCVAVIVLWVWSNRFNSSWTDPGRPRNYIRFYHRPGVTACFVSVADGKFWIARQHFSRPTSALSGARAEVGNILGLVMVRDTAVGDWWVRWNWWGGSGDFDWTLRMTPSPAGEQRPGGQTKVVVQAFRGQLAYLVLALLILPVIEATRRLVTRRRSARGFCPACGYDLRATPGRCPECGSVPGGAP